VKREAPPLAVALAIATLALSAGGLVLAKSAHAARPERAAEADGVAVRIERATWLDHGALAHTSTAHGLAPGMPPPSFQRLAVTVLVENRSDGERSFAWQRLALRGPRAILYPNIPDNRAAVRLPAGSSVLLLASFDAVESRDPLTLWWDAGRERHRLLETRTPVDTGPEPGPMPRWPRSPSQLPPGRVDVGARLFAGRGCASCHGDPEVPGSNAGAPHLGRVGAQAALRVPGRSAEEYLYESLLDPGAFLAPRCDGPGPCEPSAVPMPPYGESLSAQDAADLIAYLLAQRRELPREGPR
jgi:Cytochrome c